MGWSMNCSQYWVFIENIFYILYSLETGLSTIIIDKN
jgi:hypothetical protein